MNKEWAAQVGRFRSLNSVLLVSSVLITPVLFSASFVEPFTDPKWIAIHLGGFGLLVNRLVDRRELLLPQPYGWYPLLIGIVFTIFFLQYVIQSPLVGWTTLMRAFSIFIFLQGAIAFFRQRDDFEIFVVFNSMSMVIVTIIGYFQLFIPRLIPKGSLTGFTDSTFGYPNVTSEYLGLSVIMSLGLLPSSKYMPRFKLFFLVGIFLTCAYLIFLSCRAVWLGLIFAMLFYSFFFLKNIFNTKRACLHALLASISFAFLISALYPTIREKWNETYWETKSKNISLRWQRWKNTVHLIKENPFGVGLGRYGYTYFDYHKGNDPDVTRATFVDSSHNLGLDIFAELGVPLSLLVIISPFPIFLEVVNNRKKRLEDFAMVGASLIYFLIVASVAFPWRNPSVCILISLILGRTIAKQNVRSYRLSSSAVLASITCLILYGYYVIGFAASSFSTIKPANHYEFSKRLTELYPFSLENRLAVASYECLVEEVERCRSTALAIIESEPNYLWAYEPLAASLLLRGEKKKACAAQTEAARLDQTWYLSSDLCKNL